MQPAYNCGLFQRRGKRCAPLELFLGEFEDNCGAVLWKLRQRRVGERMLVEGAGGKSKTGSNLKDLVP